MRLKNFILTVLAAAALAAPISAQNKNSLRIGASADFTTRHHTVNKWTVSGPGLYMEYGRVINKRFSISAGLNVGGFATQESSYSRHNVTLSAYGGVRPFALTDWMKWLELGAGITGSYSSEAHFRSTYEEYKGEVIQEHHQSVRPGIDFRARAFIIDSARFELILFVTMETTFTSDWNYKWNFMDCGVMFGVKF